MRESNQILTARDVMTTSLLTFHPEQTIHEAMESLLKLGVSGAPVTDDKGILVGVLSELDCLRVFASDEFYHEEQEEQAKVEHFMTRDGQTISPGLGIYSISHYFLTQGIRRLPVVGLGNRLLGQVSRRDVLHGIVDMSRKRVPRRIYPDYLRPA